MMYKKCMEKFMQPTYFVNSDHPDIVKKAADLTKGVRHEREKAVRIFNFARDGISYNPYGPIKEKERYKASATLQRGYGYCIQKATLCAALLRAVSIPTALIFADIANPLIPDTLRQVVKTDQFVFHCYNDIFVDGRWVKATCAFDSGMCEKLNLPVVRFDGTKDAIFPPFTTDGRKFITYVRHRGRLTDVPFEEVIEVFESFYGKDVLEAAEKGPIESR